MARTDRTGAVVVSSWRSLGRRFLDLVLCNRPSATRPFDVGPISGVPASQPEARESRSEGFAVTEATDTPHQKPIQTEDPIKRKDYGHLIQTADSLVTFILEGLQSVGSNLPGIGAVAVVLSAKDKIQIEASNRTELDEILKYIENLCSAASPGVLPSLNEVPSFSPNADLIRDLKRASKDLETTKGRNRLVRTINAEAIEEELNAVWKGIDRSFSKFQLHAMIKMDGVLNNVFRSILDEATKEEDKRINDVVNQIPVAKGAKFDSFHTEQNHVESCSDGTREGVLDTVQNWATSVDEGRQRIFWLNGLAGIGKSTIAMTISKWASVKKGILGGSFFFARDVKDLSNPSLVFPTLAVQLARFDPGYKRALYEVLFEDPEIASANLQTQFDDLVLKPLSACRTTQPILLVLDALDECAPVDGVKKILQILLHFQAGSPGGPNLRVFITSRPEAHIRFMFTHQGGESQHEKVVLHDIDDNLARNDIRKYLEAEFAKLSSGTRDLPELPTDWPPAEEFDRLLDHCGKFFAYAATAIRFIGDEWVRDPINQLHEILDIKDRARVERSSNPYVDLDNLYLGVLSQTVPKNAPVRHMQRITWVLGAIACLRDPMSVDELARLLYMKSDEIRNALHYLQSVIVVKEKVRFFHQSFPDFIRDEQRCTDKRFLVDLQGNEKRIALRCLELMRSSTGVDTLSVSEYASQYWSSHVQSGNFQVTPLEFNSEDTSKAEGEFSDVSKRTLDMVVFFGAGMDQTHLGDAVCLSRETLLDASLLKMLETINAETSMTVIGLGVREGRVIVEMTNGKEADDMFPEEDHPRHFTLKKATPESIEFDWSYRDEWTYSARPSDMPDNGGFCDIIAITNNTVSVPTTTNNDCFIAIHGRADLSLACRARGIRHSFDYRWSSRMHATWDARIKFTVGSQGLKIFVPCCVTPVFHDDGYMSSSEESSGQITHEETLEKFRESFPRTIDLSMIHNELKAKFEGRWHEMFANSRNMKVTKSIFNRRGDLLLELMPKDVEGERSSFLGQVLDSSTMNEDKPFPSFCWIDNAGSYIRGRTVCFAKDVFLYAGLLKPLETVNKDMTLLASIVDVEEGMCELAMMTWKDDDVKQHAPCKFRFAGATALGLEFFWHHRNSQVYRRNREPWQNGEYKLSCTTEIIVTMFATESDCKIGIKGVVYLLFAYNPDSKGDDCDLKEGGLVFNHNPDWCVDTYMNWSASVELITGAEGLEVHIEPEIITPEFPSGSSWYKCTPVPSPLAYEDTYKKFHAGFPQSIDLRPVKDELKAAFERCWSRLPDDSRGLVACNPTFIGNGDLLLELEHKDVD